MAEQATHRCFACPLPQHATFWTTDDSTTAGELTDVLRRHDVDVTSVRPCTPDEIRTYIGLDVDPDRQVWLALQLTPPK